MTMFNFDTSNPPETIFLAIVGSNMFFLWSFHTMITTEAVGGIAMEDLNMTSIGNNDSGVLRLWFLEGLRH